ncbi:MAG: TlpA disulfide reductase family protein [Nitratireductor sp.]
MENKFAAGNRNRKVILGLALFLAAAGLWAVYGKLVPDGNVGGVASCEGSAEKAAKLSGLNTGDVAAFAIADEPKFIGDLTFNNETGAATGLAASSGKTVLLNLWATWCAPCREEMPSLDALQSEMGSDRFEVVAVSIDLKDDAKPKAFFSEIGVKHLAFRHDVTLGVFNRLKKMGLAFGMPTTLIVDGEGCALGVMNGPANWAGEDAKALIRAAVGGVE